MEKTAIDWLQEKLAKTDPRSLADTLDIFDKAKTMFRQQIEDAYRAGVKVGPDYEDYEPNYYDQTYGK